MLNLSGPERPEKPPELAPDEGRRAAIIVGVFIVWCPAYVFLVRPILNSYIFRVVDGYPALLHFFPIMALPAAVVWIHDKIYRG